MKIINLEQGSPEWLHFRRSHITSTDASVLTGHNPFSDPKTLWGQKLQLIPEKKKNQHMQRGNDLEPIARNLFQEKMKFEVEPLVIQSNDRPWQMTSLDGIDASRKRIIEIKCPKIQSHLACCSIQDIPMYYLVQMQHHLACSGAEICYYVSYHPDDPNLIIHEIHPKQNFIERMNAIEHEFYAHYLTQFKEPSHEIWQCTYDEDVIHICA